MSNLYRVNLEVCESVESRVRKEKVLQRVPVALLVTVHRFTAEARVRSWVSPCGICGGQSDTGTGFFSPSTSVFPVNFIPPVLHYNKKRKKINHLYHRVAY
jgi:hypothetical protein